MLYGTIKFDKVGHFAYASYINVMIELLYNGMNTGTSSNIFICYINVHGEYMTMQCFTPSFWPILMLKRYNAFST